MRFREPPVKSRRKERLHPLLRSCGGRILRGLSRLTGTTRSKFRIARRLLRRWRGVVSSERLDALHQSGFARSGLRFVAFVASSRLPLVGRAVLLGLWMWLVTALAVHLAAGEHQRGLKTARLLNLLFRHRIKSRDVSTSIVYFQTLYSFRLYGRMVWEVPHYEVLKSAYLARLIGRAHTFRLNPDTALAFLQRVLDDAESDPFAYLELGDACLVAGDYTRAAELFQAAVDMYPPLVMAHQNLAARYNLSAYQPKPWEIEKAGELKIYDRLGQIAEEIYLSADLTGSMLMYNKLLDYQASIAEGFDLPWDLKQWLVAECPHFDATLPTRLLPYEWVTQFGHLGLLDGYMKIECLSSRPRANHVLLAPEDKVANKEYLAYWDQHYCIVRSQDLVDALFPYQRYIGIGFMASRSTDLLAEPWARAAARAQIDWAAQKRPPLMKLREEDEVNGREALAKTGLPDEAWFVALHVRESGYYAEGSTSANAHRNARIEDYMPAIREITSRGGYVVRLGDRSMRPLPKLENVIDYAHSDVKSPSVDLAILALSRFAIGTTSGLTNVALSFGTPMVLVNCISSDWQIWTDQVDFILKKIYDRRQGRYLRLQEMTSLSVMGHTINSMIMDQMGYFVHANTAEEMRVAVAYKLDTDIGGARRADDSDPVMRKYRAAIAHNPFVYGAARPVPAFIEVNDYLVADCDAPPDNEPWRDIHVPQSVFEVAV